MLLNGRAWDSSGAVEPAMRCLASSTLLALVWQCLLAVSGVELGTTRCGRPCCVWRPRAYQHVLTWPQTTFWPCASSAWHYAGS